MRKLLLATTAMLGGLGLVGTASAQVKLNDGTTVTTPFVPAGGIGAQQPQPGNIVVHLNGRVSFTAGAYFDQEADGNQAARVPSIPGVGGTATSASPSGSLLSVQAGPEKVNTVAFGTTLRLYPGFDGVAANGLQYGAYAEIRFDQKGTPNQNPYTLSEGTFGNVNGGATSTPDVEQRNRDAAYLYQSWGYIGTPQLGIIRGGQMFDSNSMLLTGTIENFDDGGWHGANNLEGLDTMPWPFVDNGVIGTGVTSIQYLSPQIFGFDFSATFQPNTGSNVWSGCVTGVAGVGCDRLSSSADPASWARRTNTLDVAARYRGTFGPVGLAASGGFIGSGRVLPSVNGITTVSATGVSTTVPLGNFNTYKNLSVGIGGAQVSYAGLLIGGHIEWGAFGYQEALEPAGGSRQVSWVGGATYTMGPATFGFQYFNYQSSQGQTALAGPRHQTGPFIGAQYILAPGLLTYVGYGYTQSHQSGYNWQTGATTGTSAGNDIHTQLAVIGTIFSW